ncbi:MAG: LuxR C-terminal-related transcriptional regulator [Dehalococcoidia bacterium]
MRRGRPRHNDILTPREWEIVELIDQGLSNPEIAARLGISANTAKFHVSEIITKLGVTTRQEAVETALPHRASRRAAPGLLWFGSALKAHWVATTVAAALVVGIFGVMALRMNGERAGEVPPPGSVVQGDLANISAAGSTVVSETREGLRFEITAFEATAAATELRWRVTGRESDGDFVQLGPNPFLIDGTRKLLMSRESRSGEDGRSGTLLLPAIPADEGALALHIGSIRLGWSSDPTSLREIPTNWEVHFLWDGRIDGTGKVAIRTAPLPFGGGRIHLDAVSQLPEGTRIHGHFEELPPAAIQNLTCPVDSLRLLPDGVPQRFKGCRLGFGEGYRDFEVTFPAVRGEVEVTFRLAFSTGGGAAPTIPPSVALQAGSIATFRLVVP